MRYRRNLYNFFVISFRSIIKTRRSAGAQLLKRVLIFKRFFSCNKSQMKGFSNFPLNSYLFINTLHIWYPIGQPNQKRKCSSFRPFCFLKNLFKFCYTLVDKNFLVFSVSCKPRPMCMQIFISSPLLEAP